MKKIIEACIDRILEFDTQEEAAEYLEALRNKKTAFRIRKIYESVISIPLMKKRSAVMFRIILKKRTLFRVWEAPK